MISKKLFFHLSLSLALLGPFATLAAIETKKIEQELSKAQKADMKLVYIELEQAALALKKKFNKAELEQVLKFYTKINKIDDKHFYVEMFVGLYKTHKDEFNTALKSALSVEDQKEFMRKLELAITESEEGNG